jgi:hypothetical protein
LDITPAKEIDVGELLHLVDVASLCNFLVVEEDPGAGLRGRIGLADEGDVVTRVDRGAFVADDGLQSEMGCGRIFDLGLRLCGLLL